MASAIDADALFEPLSSSKKDGLGLGLSICANIVQAHGGRIWLQSGDRSTEFRFSLPLQPEPSAPLTALAAIYVIDDQDAVRHALAEMLACSATALRTFDSADDFLAALTGEKSGCIVADVRMPGTDGIELVRELGRRNARFPWC